MYIILIRHCKHLLVVVYICLSCRLCSFRCRVVFCASFLGQGSGWYGNGNCSPILLLCPEKKALGRSNRWVEPSFAAGSHAQCLCERIVVFADAGSKRESARCAQFAFWTSHCRLLVPKTYLSLKIYISLSLYIYIYIHIYVYTYFCWLSRACPQARPSRWRASPWTWAWTRTRCSSCRPWGWGVVNQGLGIILYYIVVCHILVLSFLELRIWPGDEPDVLPAGPGGISRIRFSPFYDLCCCSSIHSCLNNICVLELRSWAWTRTRCSSCRPWSNSHMGLYIFYAVLLILLVLYDITIHIESGPGHESDVLPAGPALKRRILSL